MYPNLSGLQRILYSSFFVLWEIPQNQAYAPQVGLCLSTFATGTLHESLNKNEHEKVPCSKIHTKIRPRILHESLNELFSMRSQHANKHNLSGKSELSMRKRINIY